MTRLLIIQPYVPMYRVPLFRGMRAELREVGIELAIAAGRPHGATGARDDASANDEVDFLLQESRLGLGRRSLNVRRISPIAKGFRPDLVIVEQAIKNLETYSLLARRALGRGASPAMWGQGRSYSTSQTSLESTLKQWVTQRADWFFAYTQQGADYVVGRGFDATRTTVLGNTIDTRGLAADLERVDAAARDEFARQHRLTAGRTAVFLGGVDEHKGIDFLLKAAVRIEQLLPGFVLLVGGAGAQSQRVIELQARGGPVRFLGRVDGLSKAIALSSSQVMLIPEWVGLVAVDSLLSGRPIVTTRHSSHSPEFEYLEPGRNALVTSHDSELYSTEVARILCSPAELARLQQHARLDSAERGIEGMVSRYVQGIVSWRARMSR